jgi:hypothetical protein
LQVPHTDPPSRNTFSPIENNAIIPSPRVDALPAVGTNYRLGVTATIPSPHPASLLQLMKSVYFAIRGAIEPACIYHLYTLSFIATSLPNREWRGVLFDDINSTMRNSKSPQARAARGTEFPLSAPGRAFRLNLDEEHLDLVMALIHFLLLTTRRQSWDV